jgi:hypothetical protein
VAIRTRAEDPAGIVNASGQPEIVLEINGLTVSMTPPGTIASAPGAADEPEAGESEAEA